ncbi:MAG: PfkB family carbohydrate kinase [Planctomycetaceae bacterium]
MILAMGLTPAWQQIMEFETLQAGEVNRAARVEWCASGKVLNVAWGCQQLGAETSLVTTLGGDTGRQIQHAFLDSGIETYWIETGTNARVCTTLIDRGKSQVTELVENAAPISNGALDAATRKFANVAARARVVVLSGSLTAQAPATFYYDLLAHTSSPVILDARGPELLSALARRPLLVKPNREELGKTVGYPMTNDADLQRGAAELLDRGAQWVLVTDGPRPLWLISQTACHRIAPPSREVVNPIGSGDSLAAGIAVGLWQGGDLLSAVRLGVAAASANVSTLRPAHFKRHEVDELLSLVHTT